MKKSLMFIALMSVLALPCFADVPPGVPTAPLAPELRFRSFEGDIPSLLSEEKEVPPGWTANTGSASQVARPIVLFGAMTSGAVVTPAGDVRQSGVFGKNAYIEGKADYSLKFDSDITASPLPFKGDVVVAAGMNVYRLSGTNSKWQLTLDGTPTDMTAAGNAIFLGTDVGTCLCVDGETGRVIWKHQDDKLVYRAAPVVVGDTVVFGGLTGKLTAYRMSDGELVWQQDQKGGLSAAPTYAEGQLFVGGNNTLFTSLNPENGSKVWGGGAGGAIMFSPSYDQGVVYFAGDDGVVVATKLHKVIPLWRSQPMGSLASSVIPDGQGRLFGVTVLGKVFALDAKSGKLLMSYDLGEPVATPLVLSSEQLFVVTASGKLKALPLKSDGKVVEMKLNGVVDTAPVMIDGKLWISHGSELHVVH